MKRPKLKDMTPIENARFRTMQARRAAQRALEFAATCGELSYAEQRHVAWAGTVIAITKPSWIAAASLPDLKSAMHKIRHDPNN